MEGTALASRAGSVLAGWEQLPRRPGRSREKAVLEVPAGLTARPIRGLRAIIGTKLRRFWLNLSLPKPCRTCIISA